MAKEEHPRGGLGPSAPEHQRVPVEEDPPDKADGAGVQGHPERDMIPKLNMENQHGGQGSPTPQVRSNCCSHTGQHTGVPTRSRLGSHPHRRSDLPRDPKDPGAAGLQVSGSKEHTGRPGGSRVGPSTCLDCPDLSMHIHTVHIHTCRPSTRVHPRTSTPVTLGWTPGVPMPRPQPLSRRDPPAGAAFALHCASVTITHRGFCASPGLRGQLVTGAAGQGLGCGARK